MHRTQPGGCQARGGYGGREEWRDSRRERGGRE